MASSGSAAAAVTAAGAASTAGAATAAGAAARAAASSGSAAASTAAEASGVAGTATSSAAAIWTPAAPSDVYHWSGNVGDGGGGDRSDRCRVISGRERCNSFGGSCIRYGIYGF